MEPLSKTAHQTTVTVQSNMRLIALIGSALTVLPDLVSGQTDQKGTVCGNQRFGNLNDSLSCQFTQSPAPNPVLIDALQITPTHGTKRVPKVALFVSKSTTARQHLMLHGIGTRTFKMYILSHTYVSTTRIYPFASKILNRYVYQPIGSTHQETQANHLKISAVQNGQRIKLS